MRDLKTLYKLYIQKIYGESPYLDPYDLEVNQLEDRSFNLEWSNTESIKLPIVKELTNTNRTICIHEDIEAGLGEHFFISKESPFTFATFSFRLLTDGGIQFTNVWNHSVLGKGMARWAIFNFYLENYPYILSDRAHTSAGKNYWEKLITEAINKKYKVFIKYKDYVEQIFSAEEAADYYLGNKPGHYLFKVSK